MFLLTAIWAYSAKNLHRLHVTLRISLKAFVVINLTFQNCVASGAHVVWKPLVEVSKLSKKNFYLLVLNIVSSDKNYRVQWEKLKE